MAIYKSNEVYDMQSADHFGYDISSEMAISFNVFCHS